MALPPQPGMIESRAVKFRSNSLQSLVFRWFEPYPFPYPIGPGPQRPILAPPGSPLIPPKVVASFTPQRTYFIPAMYVTQFAAGLGGKSGGGGVADVSLAIGFSQNLNVQSQGASLGTSMIDVIDSTIREFINWEPYGWLLPVGQKISVVVSCNATPTLTGYVKGTANLYLMETYEQ